MKTSYVLFFLTVLVSLQGYAQNLKKAAQNIEQQELLEHVQFLSSDQLEGRNTGYPGQKKAAEYIRNCFKSYKLSDPTKEGEPYYQSFNLHVRKRTEQLFYTSTDTLDNLTEYLYEDEKVNFKGKKTFDLVFVGFGMERDYEQVDVSGKVVIYFDGFPAIDSLPARPYLKIPDEKHTRALDHGALGSIKIFDDTEETRSFIYTIASSVGYERMQMENPIQSSYDSIHPNPIGVLPEEGARLLHISLEKLMQEHKELDQGYRTPLYYENPITLEVDYENFKLTTENVLGYLAGKDPGSCIIIGAHYDHLGIRNGKIFNGASDNASGVAAMLEIAETLAEMQSRGKHPEKSVLFIVYTGEEKGMLGSEYYVDHPVIPHDQTDYVVNLDMLGRSDFRHQETDQYTYIDISDAEQSPAHKHCLSASSKMGINELELVFSFDGKTKASGMSDHYSFYFKKIPFIYYYNGIHEDYHKPTDTFDKINYELLTGITRHIFGTVWELLQN